MITVHGQYESVQGTAGHGYVTVTLAGYGDNVPKVIGTGIIVTTMTTTVVGNSFSFQLWKNDAITPANTYYIFDFFDDSHTLVASATYSFTGSTTDYDLSTYPPLTVNPNPSIVLARVAQTGDYNDLINRPEIGSLVAGVSTVAGKSGAVTLYESDITGLVADLTAKVNSSSLKTVAFSGDYNDLSNKPSSLGAPTWGSITGTLSSQLDLKAALDAKANTSSLATVATSGSYADLTGKPTIPAASTDLSDTATLARLAAQNVFTAIQTISGTTGLGNTIGNKVVLAGGFGSPNSGRVYFGDGTGWKLHMSTRSGGTDTDRITFTDQGNLSVTGQYQVNGSQIAFTNIAGTASTSQLPARTAAIHYVIDGSGSVPTTGNYGQINIPVACTITGWVLTADASGSAVVDVLRSTYSGFPTTSSIAGTDKPTLSSVQKNQNLAISAWGSTSLSAGDQLQFNLNSVATCKRLNITLIVSVPYA
jgi:hypothetical protein